MNEERIKELFADEKFVKDLFDSRSFEEAQAKLAAEDVEISVDEVKKVYELIRKKQAGELSDEELEEVAGGVGVVFFMCLVIGAFLGGAALGGGIIAATSCP